MIISLGVADYRFAPRSCWEALMLSSSSRFLMASISDTSLLVSAFVVGPLFGRAGIG